MKAVLTFKSSLVFVIPTVQTLQKCRFGRKSDFLIQFSFHRTRCSPKNSFDCFLWSVPTSPKYCFGRTCDFFSFDLILHKKHLNPQNLFVYFLGIRKGISKSSKKYKKSFPNCEKLKKSFASKKPKK